GHHDRALVRWSDRRGVAGLGLRRAEATALGLNSFGIVDTNRARERGRMKDDDTFRILSLDGGGAKGIYTLGFLSRVEAMLKARPGGADKKLCDHFDLIYGTSTGAI